MTYLIGKRITELRTLLDSKEVSAAELISAHLEQAKKYDDELGAFNCVLSELARKQAERADAIIAEGSSRSLLLGIPIALKDNICVAGYPTTCSSKILSNFSPPYQATVAARLNQAAAVFIGKTNMDEFAMGSSTENSAFRPAKNPWDLKRVPGGSSGGSAAAVASGSAVVALGSDTGGSIRQPASFCGIAGMKPTYGLVSRFGLVAFASSLDQIGPFGRCVEDLAILLSVIAGPDKLDSSSYHENAPDFLTEMKKPIKGLKIGLIKELIGEGIDEDVRQAVLASAKEFSKQGAEVEEISLTRLAHSLPTYYLIATAEASANLARFDGLRYGKRSFESADISSLYFNSRKEGFGSEVKRRIMLGTYALSSGYYEAYYKKAQQVRRLIKDEFDSIFKSYDLLISPTCPSTAFEIGAKANDPLAMYLSDIATIPANLAGLPGISIPCGFGETMLPIGLQILGPALADAKVLQAAYAFEQATDFNTKRPQGFFPETATKA